jgi:Holliday junction resolvase
VQRIADFIAAIDGKAKRRLWQRYLDALSPVATRHWSDLLSDLPGDAWANLRTSILQQINQRDPVRGWPQALDRFNEVRAFVYLQKIGCADIEFTSASMATRGPDLIALRDGKRIACEVKTVHLKAGSVHLTRKLASRLLDAKVQASMIGASEAYIFLIATGADMATIRAAIDVSTLLPCRLVVDCGGTIQTLS